ncbi:hypothetical protein LX32DRAFT_294271 [Colletotrichum zoysiae]|uniref:Uncharacterized protein n=1 Tax=Colletotrichum zoysiae TaxID=1216348 RepID=A0AAD9H1M2_9PEZI|nr:hypothetical protein LX32DRAFT_294271 [Colletotrichum zoysiae]
MHEAVERRGMQRKGERERERKREEDRSCRECIPPLRIHQPPSRRQILGTRRDPCSARVLLLRVPAFSNILFLRLRVTPADEVTCLGDPVKEDGMFSREGSGGREREEKMRPEGLFWQRGRRRRGKHDRQWVGCVTPPKKTTRTCGVRSSSGLWSHRWNERTNEPLPPPLPACLPAWGDEPEESDSREPVNVRGTGKFQAFSAQPTGPPAPKGFIRQGIDSHGTIRPPDETISTNGQRF